MVKIVYKNAVKIIDKKHPYGCFFVASGSSGETVQEVSYSF
ncbi:MAG: hypothetical protein ACI4M0_05585 [Christensenellales bacterium]